MFVCSVCIFFFIAICVLHTGYSHRAYVKPDGHPSSRPLLWGLSECLALATNHQPHCSVVYIPLRLRASSSHVAISVPVAPSPLSSSGSACHQTAARHKPQLSQPSVDHSYQSVPLLWPTLILTTSYIRGRQPFTHTQSAINSVNHIKLAKHPSFKCLGAPLKTLKTNWLRCNLAAPSSCRVLNQWSVLG